MPTSSLPGVHPVNPCRMTSSTIVSPSQRTVLPAIVPVGEVDAIVDVHADAVALVHVGVAELLPVGERQVGRLQVLEAGREQHDDRDEDQERIDEDGQAAASEHGGRVGLHGVRHRAVLVHLVIGRRTATGSLTAHVRHARPCAVRQDRQPVQAARLRVPVGRDLRRLPLHLRLRAARRAHAAQREGRVVALDGAAARRRRRPRRVDPQPARGLGGVGPPRQLHRPAGRLQELQGALPARQARRSDDLPELRHEGQLHRGAPVQPDVQDPRRAGGGRRARGLPAAGDGPGHVHQLQERARDVAQEAAVRHRPGRQVVPQRDHAGQLRVPHP